jgi:trimeric autotransporter adhesin
MAMRITLIFLIFFSLECFGQTITTFAGNGIAGHNGDGGQATAASIYYGGGSFDKSGNYFFSEGIFGQRIRKVSTTGIVTTIVGTGTGGYSGDGGSALTAKLNYPVSVAIDTSGNLFIADAGNQRIRRVDAITGIITTVAGTGVCGYSGDNGLASVGTLCGLHGICFDSKNNLYITEAGNHVVRKIDNLGIITTVAGNGLAGNSGDGGQATSAKLNFPISVTCDKDDNVFVADKQSQTIRKIVVSTGIITTVAGNGNPTYNGDGIHATSAHINPWAVLVDNYDNLFIADFYNQRIRKVNSLGIIQTIAGTGTAGYSGDGGDAILAQIYNPEALALDTCNNLFVADNQNNRVRKIALNPTCAPINVKTIRNIKVNVNIYPSPANNEITITTTEKIKTITIANMLGQSLDRFTFTENKKEVQLDIRHLPAGVYVVRVNNIYFQKFVKE